jgi:hypothetical protein
MELGQRRGRTSTYWSVFKPPVVIEASTTRRLSGEVTRLALTLGRSWLLAVLTARPAIHPSARRRTITPGTSTRSGTWRDTTGAITPIPTARTITRKHGRKLHSLRMIRAIAPPVTPRAASTPVSPSTPAARNWASGDDALRVEPGVGSALMLAPL